MDFPDVETKAAWQPRDYKEPARWDIITALSRIVELAEGCALSEEFWESAKKPLGYLSKKFGMTKMQVVILAILVESGEAMSWRGIGKFLNCTRISIMTYTDDIDALVTRRWLIRKAVRENGGKFQGFKLQFGVVTALRHNEVFVPEKIDNLTVEEFIKVMSRYLRKSLFTRDCGMDDIEEWMVILCKANPQLPLCQKIYDYKDDIHIQSLLLLAIHEYNLWANTKDEGLTIPCLNDCYVDIIDTDELQRELQDGTHPLIEDGLLEPKCNEGMANNEQFVLTRKCKEELLEGYEPKTKRNVPSQEELHNLKRHDSIEVKSMFYNDEDGEQIEQLQRFLNRDHFWRIQQRLREKGLRQGFACLFYGAPGTGKTETVLQIARQTGRDIMEVNIAGMRDKFVGESERNIKQVFQQYRRACQACKVMPILFFNEADALINKRTEKIEQAVDRMDNAMQNIILQEIENLDGILIATTNLTSNLDKAFERRFLYKVEFHKPKEEVRAKLWDSILEDITEEEARVLAARYDFTGGQIENIARKLTVDFILTGQQASLDVIGKYCEAELMDKSRTIGFTYKKN